MKVRLRILHGKLQDKQGHDTSLDVKIRGPKFVIGSAEDCSMCCRSRSVGLHHCEIAMEPRGAVLRPLCNDNPTIVNGKPVVQERLLQAGDVLQLGRLEFQVIVESASASVDGAGEPDGSEVAEKINELLAEADEKERAFRKEHPELRYLHLDSVQTKPADAQPPAEEVPSGKPGRKKGKLPGKLPPPPPRITEDSEEAAGEALKKLFNPKHRGPGR